LVLNRLLLVIIIGTAAVIAENKNLKNEISTKCKRSPRNFMRISLREQTR
jgi:hypothetical protein